MHYLTVEELIKHVASVDARTAAGQQCLKGVSDHFKGIAKEIEKYRRDILIEMSHTRTVAVNGTTPSKANLNL
jgi:hypothetical protein